MIGLLDVDGKLPNLALMKISTYYKNQGEKVEFVQHGREYSKIYASAIFTKSKNDCLKLQQIYGDKIARGGTSDLKFKRDLAEAKYNAARDSLRAIQQR